MITLLINNFVCSILQYVYAYVNPFLLFCRAKPEENRNFVHNLFTIIPDRSKKTGF